MAVAIRQDAYIGGERVPGDGEEIEVRSPATDELLGTVTTSSATQAEAAVRAAAEAFPAWRKVSLLERVELCRAAFTICIERADEIARLITAETGKTIRESREELDEFGVPHFRRAAEDALRYRGLTFPSTQERSNAKKMVLLNRRPVGVVGVIKPLQLPRRHRVDHDHLLVDRGQRRPSGSPPS